MPRDESLLLRVHEMFSPELFHESILVAEEKVASKNTFLQGTHFIYSVLHSVFTAEAVVCISSIDHRTEDRILVLKTLL